MNDVEPAHNAVQSMFIALLQSISHPPVEDLVVAPPTSQPVIIRHQLSLNALTVPSTITQRMEVAIARKKLLRPPGLLAYSPSVDTVVPAASQFRSSRAGPRGAYATQSFSAVDTYHIQQGTAALDGLPFDVVRKDPPYIASTAVGIEYEHVPCKVRVRYIAHSAT
jgi:hypothetical protein